MTTRATAPTPRPGRRRSPGRALECGAGRPPRPAGGPSRADSGTEGSTPPLTPRELRVMERFRYTRGRSGPDPLAPPFDANAALRELGREVGGGGAGAAALRARLGRRVPAGAGLDARVERGRGRRAEAAARGRQDGVLRRARAVRDRARAAEREALAAGPSDEARLREIRLASLPRDAA